MWEKKNHMANYKNKQIKMWLILEKNGKTEVYAMFTLLLRLVLLLLLLLFAANSYTTIEIHFGLAVWQCVADWLTICFFALNDSISKQQFMYIFIVFHVYNKCFVEYIPTFDPEIPSWRIHTTMTMRVSVSDLLMYTYGHYTHRNE